MEINNSTSRSSTSSFLASTSASRHQRSDEQTKKRAITLLILLPVVAIAMFNFYYGFTLNFDTPSDVYNNFEIAILMAQGNASSSSSSSSTVSSKPTKYARSDQNQKQNTPSNQNQNQKNKKKEVPKELLYIDADQLQKNHMFSDSFLLSKARFLEMPIDKIYRIEDGALVAAWPGKDNNRSAALPYAKMLYDWTDFSVEHLSKWWGMLKIEKEKKVFLHVISILENYLQRRLSSPPSPQSIQMKNTIAMVAFMPYSSTELTHYSLAAAIVPLFKAGFGRVVVVGMSDDGWRYTREACDVMESIITTPSPEGDITVVLNDNKNNNNNTIATIEYYPSSSDEKNKITMEVAHLQITGANMQWMKAEQANGKPSGANSWNLPRGAVIGMQLALTGQFNSTKEQIEWLGSQHGHDLNYWKYVYLTEPDTVLNLNHDLLPLFRKALDDGISLFPHRIHPLPHETDLPDNTTLNKGLFLPAHPPFDKVTTLDASGDDYISCCDYGLFAPGKDDWSRSNRQLNTGCERKRWWECGFYYHEEKSDGVFNPAKAVNNHPRLISYKMMRLKDGIGVAFGSNNQGRQCIPSKTSCDELSKQNKGMTPEEFRERQSRKKDGNVSAALP